MTVGTHMGALETNRIHLVLLGMQNRIHGPIWLLNPKPTIWIPISVVNWCICVCECM
jgi:hypothetical protein